MAAKLASMNPNERRRIVEQALALLEQFYVHLPLKEAMHAVRPVQRLRLLRDRASDFPTDSQFHEELIEIFNSVRDLHTNYVLPPPFANEVAYLPFQVESYFEGGVRKYILANLAADFEHETFVKGVEILHWSGVPIARAVEISGEQHAGSNRDARHARGVAGLTMRPLAVSLPPDAEWVDIGYRALNGKQLEVRMKWSRFKVDEEDTGAASGSSPARATTIGLDLEQDIMRRANKELYVPDVAKRQRERRKKSFPYPEIAAAQRGALKRPAAEAEATRLTSARAPRRRGGAKQPASSHNFPAATFSARDWRIRPWPDTAWPVREEPTREISRRGAAAAARSAARDFPERDFSIRDFPERDFPERDFPNRGFPIRDWPNRGDIPTVGGKSRPRGSATKAEGNIDSFLPHVFNAFAVKTKHGTFGYIRLRTFNVDDEWKFLNEFIRLAALVPQNGLILDVRGNGGGLIVAGELMLQTLTPRRIEPERVQFINTPTTRALIARHSGPSRPFSDFDLGAWMPSAEQATQTGATYTEAFPITDPAAANLIGQQYHGPVVLITDARCYSTTDIFAAGFQDHGIGTIIGVDGNTGAGGANVWTHDLLLEFLKGVAGSPIATLPKGVEMRVAIRRTLRTGPAAGTPVEDLGVVPNITYGMTRKDLLEGNVDLTEFAGKVLAGQRGYVLEIVKVTNRANDRLVEVRTENLQRLDVYLADRPVDSLDIADGTTTIPIPAQPAAATLDLQGFDNGRLAAARRAFLER